MRIGTADWSQDGGYLDTQDLVQRLFWDEEEFVQPGGRAGEEGNQSWRWIKI